MRNLESDSGSDSGSESGGDSGGYGVHIRAAEPRENRGKEPRHRRLDAVP